MALQSSSQFRRSGQRDDRRRRLLVDDWFWAARADKPRSRQGAAAVERRSPRYGDAEFLDQQPRLTDLLPVRPAALLLAAMLGAGAIAGLEALHWWMLGHLATRPAAFDLASEGSLGAWFSSLVLLVASLAAVMVFAIRRHRTDDYHGRYRIWLWAAACWLLLATDEAASLHEGFQELMVYWTGVSLFGGAIWWVALYVFLLGGVGSRLAVDIWPCRLGLAALLAAGLCYVAAVAAALGVLPPAGDPRAVMVGQGAEMSGHLLVLLAMLVNARYVLLDAEGLLPVRQAETEPSSTASPSESTAASSVSTAAGRWTRTDAAHSSPIPNLAAITPAAGPPAVSAASSASASSLAAAEAGVKRKLTKAEKKALRKRLLDARQRREARRG